jgi:hypothetical protein
MSVIDTFDLTDRTTIDDPLEAELDPVAASRLVAACEQAWAGIAARHPELPEVVMVLGSGVERGRLVKLGHWWSSQWQIEGGGVRGEVLLAGEALHLGADQVFEVLLHEAAHGLNATRGIKDTSRNGRYHNARFKTTAQSVGLTVTRDRVYGWAQTALTPETLVEYVGEIDAIRDELRLARRVPAQIGLGGPGGPGGGVGVGDGRDTNRPGPVSCGCGRRLRMAPSVLAQGPVVCGLCGEPFTERRAEHLLTADQLAAAVAAIDHLTLALTDTPEPADIDAGVDVGVGVGCGR